MAGRKLFKSKNINSFALIFSMVLMSFFIVGSCNNNNNNNNNGEGEFGGTPPAPMSQCISFNAQGEPISPCEFVTTESDGSYVTCRLWNQLCVVDLKDVITQVGKGVSDSTIMWIEAWGGNGGDNDGGSDGGAGGYAVTTTTVTDLSLKNSGSTVFHFFVGANGQQGGDHCGSPGGAATLFTTEDLTLNPNSNPTQSAPPFILIAGGGGGGCGGNQSLGCVRGGCTQDGGAGGVAIGVEEMIVTGTGESLVDGDDCEFGPTGCGGNQDGMGGGGPRFVNVAGGDNSTSGTSGYGGLGGHGGSGQNCANNGFSTGFISAFLEFTSGQGGVGGSATSMCDSGGAGGGGGYGGAGGGSHGNDIVNATPGGGGGSLAIKSTKFSETAPTMRQPNPCGDEGCVTINFLLP